MSELQAARRMSLWVLPLAVGACGASMQSIFALRAPRYASALRQYNISFARRPRHADVVLVVGALTRGAPGRMRRLFASIPQPRVIIAVGNCAIDSCIFQGSVRLVAGAAEVVGANIEIAGCPPAPEAILSSILTARQLLVGEAGVETRIESVHMNGDVARVSAGDGNEEGDA